MADALDEDIRNKLRMVRLSLRIANGEHEKRAAKGQTLVSAIDDFLGDRPNGTSNNPPAPGYGLLTDAVRSVLFALGVKTFTIENVEAALSTLENAPATDRQRIGIILWKMADRGELEIVERGGGRKPTIYKVRELQVIRHKRA
jgi:hypothetical protein